MMFKTVACTNASKNSRCNGVVCVQAFAFQFNN